MIRPPWRLLTVLTATLLSCGFYAQLWLGLLDDPRLRAMDFVIFYTAGRIAQTAPLGELYDLDLQRSVQASVLGPNRLEDGLLPFNHPPFVAPLAGLVVGEDFRASYVRWALLMAALTVAVAALMAARFRRGGAAPGAALMVGLGALIFYPGFIAVLKGQDTALITLGLAGAYYGLATGRPLAAGLALGLTAIKPQLALALGLPLLLACPWAGLGLLLSAGGLGLLSVAMVGPGGVRDYLDLIALSNSGAGYGMNQEAMYNLVGLAVRAAPGLDSALLNGLKWGAFLGGVGAVCWLFWARRGRVGDAELGVATLMALAVSPHLHFHDLSLALVAVVALAMVWHRAGGRRAAVAPLVPALASLALLTAALLPGGLGYTAIYLLLAALLAALLVGSGYGELAAGRTRPARTSWPS